VVVALICFFPVAVNATDGLRSVDPEATKMMRTLDASRRQMLWRVEAPTALPFAFSGAKIAATIAPIAAIFGEWVGADSGLGVLLREDIANLQTARLFAATFVLTAIALALYGSIALAERRVVTWR
jgi:NitT/TauT family transport system permease protein/putative hydroxymethylpyrimidine transport system permease protein